MLKRALLSLVILASFACPKPQIETTPEPKPKAAEKPVIPAAPTFEGRRTDFTLVKTSKTPQGFDSGALYDANLGTSWISRLEKDSPLTIEFGMSNESSEAATPSKPGKPAEPVVAGVCIKKIGFVTGVFGNPGLAKQVARPTKMKISYLQTAGKPAKGKAKEPTKNELTVELPEAAEGSTEIQWLELPETCKVTRTTIVIEALSSSDIQDVAIAELYVDAQ